ncbi:ORF2 [Astrovirus wild boar/WBAstV-1/2011/HUN]|uniref:ORF2 n=1 Tax=Astrovirus wild boar/WBAstV-1/2011/HUN TaxID=1137931 RepID=UPI00024EB47D|nr:ORF2 [Astrovirus wild boar/WBAstV-1/2011/HUN]AEZ67026.1 ORF2 [Astrovirus wild boar/WBAstV-1/2011/HUN]
MANNQKNVQPKVVTTTTTTTSRRRGRRRRRTPRTATSSKTTVRKVAVLGQSRRPPRRRFNRPGNSNQPSGSTFKQRITATLGTIGSNQGNTIELEASVLLNPALMKETTGSNAFGPLQMYAANYSLWRARDITVKLTPLIGGSAVSGTAIRTSLNLSAQPGSPSWSALGARRHRDTNPGRPMVMRIPGNAILGQKKGWFLCNTKNDPMMCIAGSIEIHTLGKTLSAYRNEDFTGPLFLAELTATWEFKNYNPEPGMLNLVKTKTSEQPQTIKIHSKPGDPILISVPSDSQMARTVAQVSTAADSSASEIVWQICDATAMVVEGLLPQPFEWLFKAGWWFVKKIANKSQNRNRPGEPDPGELTFQVFQSISDAQNGVPCIATGNASSTNARITNLEMMQITPGNLGNAQVSPASMGRSGNPTTNPITIVCPSMLSQPPIYATLCTKPPLNCIAMQGLGQHKRKVHSYSIHELSDPSFFQDGNVVDPLTIPADVYPIYKKVASEYTPIGEVYAASYAKLNNDPLHWTLCLWRATVTTEIKMQGMGERVDQFFFIQPNIEQDPARLPRFTQQVRATNQKSTGQEPINVSVGKWYLTVFASYRGTQSYNNNGVNYFVDTQLISGGSLQIDPGFDAYPAGAVLTTAQPLQLNIPVAPTTLTTREILAFREMVNAQSSPFPLPPPPSEYDNLEMPPLEGEEEEEQGAIGDPTPLEEANQQRIRGPAAIIKMNPESALDVKNWVEFGHRKRPPTPFSPIEEEEEEDSDLDDDDYAEPPEIIKNLLTPEAKDLYGDLRRKGLSHEQATRAAQAAFPHMALEAWEAAYHNAMADGLSPPTARDCAWSAVSDFLS